jgi:L-rhamnose mutarotase
MSYEIVKSIEVKDGKVFTRHESNNVYPKYYTKNEHNYLTKILNEKGHKELMKILFEDMMDGNIELRPSNKLTREMNEIFHKVKKTKEFDSLDDEKESISNEMFRLRYKEKVEEEDERLKESVTQYQDVRKRMVEMFVVNL